VDPGGAGDEKGFRMTTTIHPEFQAWKDNHLRYKREWEGVEKGLAETGVELTIPQKLAVHDLVSLLGDVVSEIVVEGGSPDDFAKKATDALTGDGPVLAMALAAIQLDRVIWHEEPEIGVPKPPLHGFVARALQQAIDLSGPIAKHQEPLWYENVVDPGVWPPAENAYQPKPD
jgi:hypothetical protein